jgi:hypothetical protein
MAGQYVFQVPQYFSDDGVTVLIQVTDSSGKAFNCGFLHRPFYTPAPTNGTLSPPLPWVESSNLDGWVETLKYGIRNEAKVQIAFDDELRIEMNAWSVSITGVGSYGGNFYMNPIYYVAG